MTNSEARKRRIDQMRDRILAPHECHGKSHPDCDNKCGDGCCLGHPIFGHPIDAGHATTWADQVNARNLEQCAGFGTEEAPISRCETDGCPNWTTGLNCGDCIDRMTLDTSGGDAVNHPSHYTAYGAEIIEITEHLNFCMGNAVKYIARADLKGNPLEDLHKARWYIDREIQRRTT